MVNKKNTFLYTF